MAEIQPSLLDFLPPVDGGQWTVRGFVIGHGKRRGEAAGGTWEYTFTWPHEPRTDDPELIDYLSGRYVDDHWHVDHVDQMRILSVQPAEEVNRG